MLMDSELKQRVEEIQNSLNRIDKGINPSRWNLVIQGLWRGVGYLVGLVITVALLGWMLNLIGVIPFLTDFSQDMKSILDGVKTK